MLLIQGNLFVATFRELHIGTETDSFATTNSNGIAEVRANRLGGAAVLAEELCVPGDALECVEELVIGH